MSIEQFLSDYGCLAIAVGCFLEGETFVVLGGMAAHQGHLTLPLAMLAAFLGAVFGDQLWFQVGRHGGQRLLARWPRVRSGAATIEDRLGRGRDLFLFGFRFLYGLRVVSPFVIGLSAVSAVRFSLLNSLGAVVWAAAFALLGFWFGHGVEAFLGDFQQHELHVFGGVATIGLVVWVARRRRAPAISGKNPSDAP